MALNIPLTTWISWAKITQYLEADRKAKKAIFQGGSIVPDYSNKLRRLRQSIEWAYAQNPNDPTLNQTGIYMFSLIDAAAAQIIVSGVGNCISPTITQNPNSQTISSGGTATFSVLASGTAPLSYQWQLNLVNITLNGNAASYTTPAVTSGGNYRCIVSNACGTTPSGTATLTVNAPAINFVIGWAAGDPFINNTTPLTITNSQTFNYTPGANIVYSGSLAAFANTYVMWQILATEPTPTSFFNTNLNMGVIPGFEIRDVYTVGSFKYVCCRNPLVLDITQNLSLNH